MKYNNMQNKACIQAIYVNAFTWWLRHMTLSGSLNWNVFNHFSKPLETNINTKRTFLRTWHMFKTIFFLHRGHSYMSLTQIIKPRAIERGLMRFLVYQGNLLCVSQNRIPWKISFHFLDSFERQLGFKKNMFQVKQSYICYDQTEDRIDDSLHWSVLFLWPSMESIVCLNLPKAQIKCLCVR